MKHTKKKKKKKILSRTVTCSTVQKPSDHFEICTILISRTIQVYSSGALVAAQYCVYCAAEDLESGITVSPDQAIGRNLG